MFFIISFGIYAAGRAFGCLVLCVAKGNSGMVEHSVDGHHRWLGLGWLVTSFALSAVICFFKTDWGLSLPL